MFSFKALVDKIKAAAAIAEPIVEAAAPLEPFAEAVLTKFVPSSAGAIAAVKTLGPVVIKDVAVAVDRAKELSAHPAVVELEGILGGLLHLTDAPQAVVLTPTATTATAPAKPAA